MASNNINTQSHFLRRRSEKLTYFCREMGLEWKIHVSTPRCYMSTFLLKSYGGTPQNIHFNVFVIVMRSIHRETFEMQNLSVLLAHIPDVFATPFI